MSILPFVECDTGSLSLDDIFRLITAVSATGDIYIRIVDDGTDPDDLDDLVACNSGAIMMLDILRGALVINDDGDYALNVATIT